MIEREKKFLVDRAKIPTDEWWPIPFMSIRIEQTYLEPFNTSGVASRVRKSVIDGQTKYTHTTKRRISMGVYEELESDISVTDYEKLLQEAGPSARTIKKTRRVFVWNGQMFELDLFDVPLESLAVLELEFATQDAFEQTAVDLPTFLPVLIEVTDNPAYTNAALSRLTTK